jgi:hypothetical protein
MIAEMIEELEHKVVAEAGSIQIAEPLARTSTLALSTSISAAPLSVPSRKSLPHAVYRYRQRLRAGRRPAMFNDSNPHQGHSTSACCHFRILASSPNLRKFDLGRVPINADGVMCLVATCALRPTGQVRAAA